MASITINATATQSARIQEAVGIHNAQTGQTLTVKQWVYLTLRTAAVSLISQNLEEQNAVTEAANSHLVNTDMQGGT